MCRNIKMLFNFDPPVTAEEVRAASLQYVRKISGFNKPSKANEAAFQAAVDDVAAISSRLLHSLETNAVPKSREEEAAKAKARALRDSARKPTTPQFARVSAIMKERAAKIAVLVLALAALSQPGTGRAEPLKVNNPGTGSVPLSGSWQFDLGDDKAWADPALDDSNWEPIRCRRNLGAAEPS